MDLLLILPVIILLIICFIGFITGIGEIASPAVYQTPPVKYIGYLLVITSIICGWILLNILHNIIFH